MTIKKEDVKYIASLAKLKFDENEIEKFTEQFNEIISYIEKLNELDTSNVEPLAHPFESNNVFRNDELKKSASTEEALKNSPSKTEEFFRVPKVINQP
ncbi:MAG: Asp-tRNA(Asn)/Glu-tRNA(Gln) amidotransferase subunit GatC [Stygiobacter sp.]|jgi:aspartyl-tRNA(Asn)/glutamyl-tRNA(Gln) amidotransferase subunit C|uniref:Aspartyl/glutamyl-tRNA(Asn/Gln) amidotransferase subunit C n=1 Tax=Stygiobacter electus TaxID=3032292 RepID=A0AAE3P257_9BACT|nr:Asp-tRNA(Asn)/Glu-tRNA(Gln) amidotransferase subunit GatC [Stygiobacter electus]MDF1612875.1 Asp-tRNA(Asn)/Glu-tRNA(Gln) amidotransferase subunit GatC [Stygiobacter electus]